MRRSILLLPAILLLGACETTLSTDRAAPGETVTVTPTYSPDNPFPDECLEGPVTVYVFDGVTEEEAGTGTADDEGFFQIDIQAPGELGEYEVTAECGMLVPVVDPMDPMNVIFEPGIGRLSPAQLLVTLPLVLTVEPAEVAPGETALVTGTWCISQGTGSEVPVAEVTFAGATTTIDGDEAQPFGESWELEVTAPAEPGEYPITATCTYDDEILLDEGDDGEEGDDGGEVLDDAGVGVAAAVTAPYEAVSLTVAAPVAPPTPPAPPAPPAPAPSPAPAPRAGAVTAAPTFVG